MLVMSAEVKPAHLSFLHLDVCCPAYMSISNGRLVLVGAIACMAQGVVSVLSPGACGVSACPSTCCKGARPRLARIASVGLLAWLLRLHLSIYAALALYVFGKYTY